MTEEGGLLIDSIDTDKPLFEADSCLEFLILSFCHNFELVPKQAAGLLVQGNKYLAHIAAKGLRGEFDPVVFWCQNIYSNSSHLAELIETDQGQSLVFVLDALKLGLMSRSVEVVQWSCRLFTKLALDFSERGLIYKAWDWFVLPQSALELGFLATQRHTEATEVAVEMLLHFSSGRLVDLFTIYLRNFLQETGDYLAFITGLMQYINASDSVHEELQNSGVTGYWCELAFREAEMDSHRSNSAKLFSLAFLFQVWGKFYASQTEEIMIEALVTCYKRTAREDLVTVKMTAVALLFECLVVLVELKNKMAIVLYKSLTFILLENHGHSIIRELLCYNFKSVLETYSTMPTAILVDPLVKRLQLTETTYFTFDFDLFMTLASHPMTDLESAVLLIDVIGKIYVSDIAYARAASVPFTVLASRYITKEPMIRYLETFCSLAIKTAVSVSRATIPPSYSSLRNDNLVEVTDIAASRQRRTIVLDMVCWIVQQDSEELNGRVKDMLIKTNRLYSKQTSSDLNCLMVVLGLFGDPLEVIASFYDEHPTLYQEDFPRLPTPEEAENSEPDSDQTLGEEEFLALIPLKLTDSEVKEAEKKPKTKRGEFPWQRVHASMEQAKAKHQELERKRREIAEAASKKEEQRSRKTEITLKIRRLEQNIQRGESASNLLGEGQANKYLVQQALELVTFFPEDKDEEDVVKVVLKRYSRLFKVMFQRHAGTGFARKQQGKSEIEWMADRKEKMTDAELVKCLKDYGVVPKLMSKEEVGEVMKLYNQKVSKSTELAVVDYDGFLGVLCQLAYLAFSRHPSSMTNFPAAVLVKELVRHIRACLKAGGQSTEVIDESDTGTGDRDVVRRLNELLKSDADVQMPENYVRVVEKDIAVEFAVPSWASQSESTNSVLEVLDDILFKAIGTHLLEPRVVITQSYKARGHVAKKPEVPLPPIHERPASLLKRRFKENAESVTLTLKQRIVQDVKINSTLKLLVAQAPNEDRSDVAVVAEVLEGVLLSVSLGLNRVINRNKAMTKETSAKQLVEPADEERIARLKKRDQMMRIELSKAREERDAKQREQQARLKEEAEDEGKRRRLKEAKLKKELDERTKQMKLWKEQKQQAKVLPDEQRKVTSSEKKKKEDKRLHFEQKNKQLIEEKKQSYIKLKEKEHKKTALPTLDIESHKRMSERLLAGERKKRESAEEQKSMLLQVLGSVKLQELMSTYAKQLELVFKHYCKRSELKIEHGIEAGLTNLYAADLLKLALELGISPAYATSDEVGRLFRYLTRTKDISPKMLDYSEFQEALVRIAAGAKEKLSTEELSVWTVEALLRALGLTENPKAVGRRLKDFQDNPGKLVRNLSRVVEEPFAVKA
jgi:hypothetical protein